LFDKKTGIIAGIVLGYSQAFIIANYDVRTDAILTGATAYAIYQFIKFSANKKYIHIVLGALGVALAVGTKGMIAVIITGFVVVIHLLYHRKIKEIFTWQWLSSILWSFIFLSPFMYCYYLQFDSHPEKVTNGVKGMSGIKFLLWTQSFERLAGQRNMVNSNDYTFFFHTFLWAFLPWSFLAYYETFRDWIVLIKKRFATIPDIEFTLSGSTLLIMLLMSTSKFKLPHYINILFPLFAVITAKSIFRLIKARGEILQWVRVTFYMISGLYVLLAILLNAWAFPVSNLLLIIGCLISVIFIAFAVIRMPANSLKPVFITLLIAGVSNLLLNINFFPQVLSYQGSSSLADYVNASNIPKEKIVSFTARRYYAFDFYIEKDTPEPDISAIKQKANSNKTFYILTDKIKMQELSESGIVISDVRSVPHFHVSTLKLKFINPATRTLSLDTVMLVKIN
jgi:4-amino-4-deoxy-L-arabinose transferase-like glycosyltransferase